MKEVMTAEKLLLLLRRSLSELDEALGTIQEISAMPSQELDTPLRILERLPAGF
jgi:hypothetical protein